VKELDASIALSATDLGKRFPAVWALRDCTVALPAGRMVALVGPTGAGKSTLMMLAAGVLHPTLGELRVLGDTPGAPATRTRVAYLADERPLYRGCTVAEILRRGRRLNRTWDDRYAERLIRDADIPTGATIRSLPAGQQRIVALTLVLARRPQLVLLDEPLSDLDPVARRQVAHVLTTEVAGTGLTVVLSSEVGADLDTVCDHVVLLDAGQVRLAGDADDLLASHRLITGPSLAAAGELAPHTVVEHRGTGGRSTLLVRTNGAFEHPGWAVDTPTLGELVLGYLRTPRATLPEPTAAA
jgi:ABC-2 type transport system ATP-binding protein